MQQKNWKERQGKKGKIREEEKRRSWPCIYPTQGTSSPVQAVRIENGHTVLAHGAATVIPHPTSRRQ